MELTSRSDVPLSVASQWNRQAGRQTYRNKARRKTRQANWETDRHTDTVTNGPITDRQVHKDMTGTTMQQISGEINNGLRVLLTSISEGQTLLWTQASLNVRPICRASHICMTIHAVRKQVIRTSRRSEQLWCYEWASAIYLYFACPNTSTTIIPNVPLTLAIHEARVSALINSKTRQKLYSRILNTCRHNQ